MVRVSAGCGASDRLLVRPVDESGPVPYERGDGPQVRETCASPGSPAVCSSRSIAFGRDRSSTYRPIGNSDAGPFGTAARCTSSPTSDAGSPPGMHGT